MATQVRHMCMSVRGFIRNNKFPRDYKNVLQKDGKTLEPDEAREFLFDCLKEGKEVLPFGDCDNFDYSGGGCQGHPVEEESAA